MKLLFVYNHQYPDKWRDGLYAALKILEREYSITWLNLATHPGVTITEEIEKPDFILGWGAFNSPVDRFLQVTKLWTNVPRGLCLAGNTFPFTTQTYDVIFYETEWAKKWLEETASAKLPLLVHAFGVNSQIFCKQECERTPSCEYCPGEIKVFDYLTVGAFSLWKRQDKMLEKIGRRIAIGEIQKDNLEESMGIIAPLLMDGVMVSDMVSPHHLAQLYRLSEKVYIPATPQGGGERAVLEAQAVGCQAEVEDDNIKLKELVGKSWDEKYYASQLKKGIESASRKQ